MQTLPTHKEKIDKDLRLDMCALKAPFIAQVVTAQWYRQDLEEGCAER